MADFSKAILRLLQNEGDYDAPDPDDPGGETFRGVARAFTPEWIGWPMIDAAKKQPGFPRSLDADSALQQAVIDFYRTTYWLYDGIDNQDVATKVLDMCVNMGQRGGMGCVQRAVQTCIAGPIVVDGLYGQQTERAINAIDPATLLRELRFQSVDHYCRIVLAMPSKQKFLVGWLRRGVQ